MIDVKADCLYHMTPNVATLKKSVNMLVREITQKGEKFLQNLRAEKSEKRGNCLINRKIKDKGCFEMLQQ